jgi:Uma2 family endonuclease
MNNMPFVIEESWLPATLTVPPMTDEQFAEFCAEHPDLSFEMTAEGELIVMPPNYTATAARNGEIMAQLRNWARPDGRGICTDSSGGFVLPSGARRSPDAAWTQKSRIQQLAPAQHERFWHLCPDFVIELRSHWDRLPTLRAKMHEWIANGAQLAWLIDAERHAVEIFRPGSEPETLLEPSTVEGEGPVTGFTLDLPPVWDPLGLSV